MVVPPYYPLPPTGYGGIEEVATLLIDALVARGHEVTVIGAGEGGHTGEHVATYPEPLVGRIGESVPEVVHAAEAEVALGDLDPDLVHDHTLAGLLCARKRVWPTVATAHGPVTDEIGRLYAAVADSVHLVAISDAQRRLAPDLRWAGRVYHGLEISDWPYCAEKEDYALFLGRITPDKGPGVAVEAARRAGMRLLIAGKVSEDHEQRCFDTEVAPHVGKGVEWLGVADSETKRQLMAKARCLLFPIQWEEPFGMVMIEAMATGTPVVAFGRGSVPEVVDDGVTGFVVDDLDGLVEGMRQASTIDPASCRKRVEMHFRVDDMAKGYEDIYRTVLAG